MVTGDGFGFPSGHSLKSSVVYGGATLVFEVWERHRQRMVAAIAVGLIALSRVVLGVHYLADVVVGTIVGLAFLRIVTQITRKSPRRALAIAVALGVVAITMTTDYKAGIAAGTAAVTLAIWELTGNATLEEVATRTE